MRVRFPETIQSVILTLGTLALILGTMTPADAQELKALQTQKDPLVLKAQGSFYVGGEAVKQTRGELGNFGPAGQISVTGPDKTPVYLNISAGFEGFVR